MASRQTKAITIPPVRTASKPVQLPDGVEGILALALGGSPITLDVPTTATLGDVETTLSGVIEGYKLIDDARERLRPVIGRLIVTIETRKLYRPEYRNITDYIERFIEGKLKFARQTGFDCRRIARAFPTMSEAEYARYGASRLLEAAKETDETDPKHRELLDTLLTMTVAEGKEFLATRRGAAEETPNTRVISVRVATATAVAWESFVTASGRSAAEEFVAMFTAYKAAVEASA